MFSGFIFGEHRIEYFIAGGEILGRWYHRLIKFLLQGFADTAVFYDFFASLFDRFKITGYKHFDYERRLGKYGSAASINFKSDA